MFRCSWRRSTSSAPWRPTRCSRAALGSTSSARSTRDATSSRWISNRTAFSTVSATSRLSPSPISFSSSLFSLVICSIFDLALFVSSLVHTYVRGVWELFHSRAGKSLGRGWNRGGVADEGTIRQEALVLWNSALTFRELRSMLIFLHCKSTKYSIKLIDKTYINTVDLRKFLFTNKEQKITLNGITRNKYN